MYIYIHVEKVGSKISIWTIKETIIKGDIHVDTDVLARSFWPEIRRSFILTPVHFGAVYLF